MTTTQSTASWRRSAEIFLGPVRQLLLRRLTARWRALPNVFIVGAVKAGTTSMAAYLEEHPAYLPAYTKELLYLHDLPGLAGNEVIHPVFKSVWGRYQPGNEVAYRKFFPRTSALRAAGERTGSTSYTGDHTPFHLYCPTATRRIHRLCPGAKIIMLLRDPIERAFADFNMHRARNPLERRSFAQAIEEERAGEVVEFRMRYLEKSTYEPHVRRYHETFPAEQVLILRSEDFFDPQHTAEIMRTTFRFLGLEPVPMKSFTVHNRGSYTTPLEASTRRLLEDHFRPSVQSLRQLLGTDFGWDL